MRVKILVLAASIGLVGGAAIGTSEWPSDRSPTRPRIVQPEPPSAREQVEIPGLERVVGEAPEPLEGSTVLHGTISVIDENGVEHHNESGRINFLLHSPFRGSGRNVEVVGGEWSFETERGQAISMQQVAALSRRRVLLDGLNELWMPTGEPIRLSARWTAPTVLNVMSARTGRPLDEIEVVGVISWAGKSAQGFHPGDYPDHEILARSARSPIDMTALRHGHDEHAEDTTAGYVFVRSPGFAWDGETATPSPGIWVRPASTSRINKAR